jgi:Type IV secretion system pilin
MSIFNKLFTTLAILFFGFGLLTTSLNVSARDLLPSTQDICGKAVDNKANATTGVAGSGSCLVTGGETVTGGATGIVGTIINVARTVTYISGGLAVLFLVYGGVRYLISGDEKEAGTARTIIQNAVVGLVITVIAYSIISIVTGVLSGQFI